MKEKLAVAFTMLDAFGPVLLGILVWALAIGFAFNLNVFQAIVAAVMMSEVSNGLHNIQVVIKAKK